MAVIGGLLNAAAFPGLGWWPLILFGTPMLLWALTARRLQVAVVSAAAGAATFWGAHTFWLTVYLGAAPWLGLAGLQTLFSAAAGVAIAVTWRAAEHVLRRDAARLLVIPILVAGIWVARELVAGNWPYGGFAWGRLAFSQSESPLGELAAWVGATGLSYLIAAVSALAVQVVRDRHRMPRVMLLLPVATLVGLVAMPAFPVEVTGTLRVGAVQGDSEAGLLAQNEPGRILRDHLAATAPLLGEDLDLLVWPENSADVDPLRDPATARILDDLTATVDAPMLVGTITADDERMFNSSLVWEHGLGATGQYDKKHPVPFAEYLPDRDFWFPLAPELFSLIPRDFSPGVRPNVLDIDGILAGVAICFDIVDDALVRDMVGGGAQLILAPTNNADFGQTDQSAQQLAIARLRAIETGRSVVNASTVGVSALVSPAGATIERLQPFTPGAMVGDVPLSTTITPAMTFGGQLGWALAAVGVIASVWVNLHARRPFRTSNSVILCMRVHPNRRLLAAPTRRRTLQNVEVAPR